MLYSLAFTLYFEVCHVLDTSLVHISGFFIVGKYALFVTWFTKGAVTRVGHPPPSDFKIGTPKILLHGTIV